MSYFQGQPTRGIQGGQEAIGQDIGGEKWSHILGELEANRALEMGTWRRNYKQ